MTSSIPPEPPAQPHIPPDQATLGDSRDEERAARATWSRLAEPADTEALEFVESHGAAAALARVHAGHGERRWQARLHELDTARDRAILERLDGRLLIPGDEEWPVGLLALGGRAPFCLWVRGPLRLGAATTRSVAIVGARASTPYGDKVATDLAEGCARRGITVVAGAGFGIDGSAHRGALAADGPTIAVLPCGIDRAYPSAHEQLIAQIGERGAVISEIPPGSPLTRMRFIERGRLIAAICQATVVVEAGHRSTALHTASQARALGLPVAAVPGPVTSAVSYGCHRLLREGAICVTSADDIVALISAPL